MNVYPVILKFQRGSVHREAVYEPHRKPGLEGFLCLRAWRNRPTGNWNMKHFAEVAEVWPPRIPRKELTAFFDRNGKTMRKGSK